MTASSIFPWLLVVSKAVQLIHIIANVLQLDVHELHCGVSVLVDMWCVEVVVLINVGESKLAAWLRDYCVKQNFDRGHQCGVCGRRRSRSAHR